MLAIFTRNRTKLCNLSFAGNFVLLLMFGGKRMSIVRDYRVSDLDAVISVFQHSIREIASRDYSPIQVAAWSPERPDRDAWSARLGRGGVFVCERDGGIVGFARIDESGHVDLLYVHPKFQRQGVARALFERVVVWALRRSVRRLTSDVSLTARPFFERAEFHMVRSQEVECRGVSFQSFRMERDIDAEQYAGLNAARRGVSQLGRYAAKESRI